MPFESLWGSLLGCFLVISPIFTYAAQQEQERPVILFDLGGVLLENKTRAVLKELGTTKLALYAILKRTSPRAIKLKLYEVLEKIRAAQPDMQNTPWGISVGNIDGTADNDGTTVPGIMCDWMRGSSSYQIVHHVLKTIESNKGWFKNGLEQTLVRRLARMIFTPQRFAATCKVSHDGLAFVRRCKQKGYRIAILSNWDRESIQIIKQAHPELFGLFDSQDIFISGEIGALKPDQKLFAHIKERLGSGPCILIDDQRENVKNAREAGLMAVLCGQKSDILGIHHTPDFKQVVRHLNTLCNFSASPCVDMRCRPTCTA
jgi:HAD superfamily hydrolase (TIGR01549 family)